jgi:hypothetical protein
MSTIEYDETPKHTPNAKQLAATARKIFSAWGTILAQPDTETRTLGEGDPAELASALGWNVVHRQGTAALLALEGTSTLWAVGPDRGRVVALRLEGGD